MAKGSAVYIIGKSLRRRIVLAITAITIVTVLLALSFMPLFEVVVIETKTLQTVKKTASGLYYSLAKPLPFNTGAVSAIVIDIDSGQVLGYANPTKQLGMASTTKIMTALVSIELMPPDCDFVIPKAAVGIFGSSIYLVEGETLTIRQLLYGLLLESGNDSAVALAIATAGSEELFVALMNAKATELGLKNTHFANPHGLTEQGHYTTAEDLATITAAAMRNPLFVEIVATKKWTIPYKNVENGRQLFNHNKLLMSDPNIIGVKTGWTSASGRCLVTAYQNGEQRLAVVTLNCSAERNAHKLMYAWAIERFEGKRLIEANEISRSVNVVGGTSSSVICRNPEGAYICLPKGTAQLREEFYLPQFLYAPVKKGEKVGSITYYSGDNKLLEIPLVADADVKNDILKINFWEKLKEKLNGR